MIICISVSVQKWRNLFKNHDNGSTWFPRHLEILVKSEPGRTWCGFEFSYFSQKLLLLFFFSLTLLKFTAIPKTMFPNLNWQRKRVRLRSSDYVATETFIQLLYQWIEFSKLHIMYHRCTNQNLKVTETKPIWVGITLCIHEARTPRLQLNHDQLLRTKRLATWQCKVIPF